MVLATIDASESLDGWRTVARRRGAIRGSVCSIVKAVF